MNEEQQRIASGIEAIMLRKNPDDSYRYTKEELRGFIVACVLELGLELPAQLEGVFTRFLENNIQVAEDCSDEDLVNAIKAHFQENPLNPELLKELENFARKERVGDRDEDDSEDAATREVARLRGTGQETERRAPREETTPKGSAPKPKKGLS
jgi:hypothetical protein